MSNILFVTAHPDDESLWVGGLLNFLKKSKGVDPFVICMTGKNDSRRYYEFKSAMEVVGIDKWVMGNINIPNTGEEPLFNIQNIFEECLNELKLGKEDIDLLITHSFYGDEHEHLQHRQLFNHFSQLDFPFAFFSSMTIPAPMHPIMRDMRRLYNTHLINAAEVQCPVATHYLQFKVDGDVKKEMLSQYVSVGVEEHRQGYAAWDSCIEGLYFKNTESYRVFDPIINYMACPGGPRIFSI